MMKKTYTAQENTAASLEEVRFVREGKWMIDVLFVFR